MGDERRVRRVLDDDALLGDLSTEREARIRAEQQARCVYSDEPKALECIDYMAALRECPESLTP